MAARERERRRKAHNRADSRETRRIKKNSRRRIRRIIFGSITGLGAALIVLSLVLPSSLGKVGNNPASAEQGAQVTVQENEVVEVEQLHATYNTTPPTSGWHYDIPLEDIVWGASQETVENETQVSYLERGSIMVQYNCPPISIDIDGNSDIEECLKLQKQLEQVVNRYPEGVILAPYPNMDSTIALTSWGWIDTFEDFSDPRIDDFIQAHIGNGPSSFR